MRSINWISSLRRTVNIFYINLRVVNDDSSNSPPVYPAPPATPTVIIVNSFSLGLNH